MIKICFFSLLMGLEVVLTIWSLFGSHKEIQNYVLKYFYFNEIELYRWSTLIAECNKIKKNWKSKILTQTTLGVLFSETRIDNLGPFHVNVHKFILASMIALYKLWEVRMCIHAPWIDYQLHLRTLQIIILFNSMFFAILLTCLVYAGHSLEFPDSQAKYVFRIRHRGQSRVRT